MIFYVKKIWSLNPTKYMFVSFEKAMKGYNEYLSYWEDTRTHAPKTFEEWLKSEISVGFHL
jgi:hypothetical protein